MCWECKDYVKITCPLHGDLLPCLEHAVGRARKDPAKCPVPSFAKVVPSGIPGAGYGVFAEKFIYPGQIIGM